MIGLVRVAVVLPLLIGYFFPASSSAERPPITPLTPAPQAPIWEDFIVSPQDPVDLGELGVVVPQLEPHPLPVDPDQILPGFGWGDVAWAVFDTMTSVFF